MIERISRLERVRLASEEIETETGIEKLIEEIDQLSEQKEHRTILHNDDFHLFDDVVALVQLATGKNYMDAYNITLEAHTSGRAICYSGLKDDCERVAGVLRRGGLIAEVD
jgi:ATP-dependent Clp protease adapter protein ClpS